MPRYSYSARNAEGARIEGLLEAATPVAVADQLIARGFTPLDVRADNAKEAKSINFNFSFGKPKVSDEDLMFFSRQMNTLMRAGVPILQALAGLRDSATHPQFASMLSDLRESLDSGRELSIAMRETGIFSNFYISMVRVGELTGGLDQIFLRLFEHLRFEKDMRAKIKAALRYPSFVVIAMVIAMAVINVLVIPSFSKVFKALNSDLPFLTQVLIGVSDFTVHYWYLCALGIAAVFFSVRSVLATPSGRLGWDRLKLRLPLVGGTIYKAMLSRLSRSLGLTLQSGLPVIQAFAVTAEVIDNHFIESKLHKMRQGVEHGESITRTAVASGIFNPVVLQMIAVGEESGDIDGLLREIADMYEREVEFEVDTLSARIEPVLIIGLAGMVLVLALGIFLPIWDLTSAMTKH